MYTPIKTQLIIMYLSFSLSYNVTGKYVINNYKERERESEREIYFFLYFTYIRHRNKPLTIEIPKFK